MSKLYTIEDIAAFTGLTDRTLRSYLKEGRLAGTTEEGAWRFTPEEVERLLEDSGARRAIEAGRNAVIYDFLLGGQQRDRCCAVRDIPMAEGGEEALRLRLLERVHQEEGVKFSYFYDVDRRGQGSSRVILMGPTAAVQKVLADT